MTELLTSWIGHLRNADHVGITTEIYDSAKAAGISNELYAGALTALETAVKAEDEAYRKVIKDWKVEELKQADEKLDAYMRGIRQILTGHSSMPDEPQRKKAQELLQLWKVYNFKSNDGYTAEASKVINMYQDVERRKADAESLGVWSHFEQALEWAQKVLDLLDQRFTELSTRAKGEMKNARSQTDSAIKKLYQLINSLQLVLPSEQLTALALKLKTIEDYARIYYLHIGASKSGSDDEPTTPPSGGTDNKPSGPGGSAGGE